MHQVSIEPLLDKLGYEYDKSGKYKALDGTNLGKPENPTNLKITC
jgi:hypothetical protein